MTLAAGDRVRLADAWVRAYPDAARPLMAAERGTVLAVASHRSGAQAITVEWDGTGRAVHANPESLTTIEEEPMPRRRDDDDQPQLVPMSSEELQKASAKLARMVGELAEMEADHAEIRKEQKTEWDKLAGDIQGLAATVRSQGR